MSLCIWRHLISPWTATTISPSVPRTHTHRKNLLGTSRCHAWFMHGAARWWWWCGRVFCVCVLHVGNKMKLIGRRRAESLVFICGGLAFFHSFPSRLSDQQMNFGCFFVVDSLPSYFLVENEISRQPHCSLGYIAQHFPRSPVQHQSPWTLIGPCCKLQLLLGRRPLVAGAY